MDGMHLAHDASGEVLEEYGGRMCGIYANTVQQSIWHGSGREMGRNRFASGLTGNCHGHSISVRDVLVLNKAGVVASYYVEKSS